MKLLLLFLLISSYTFAQVNENHFFAVINDKDGYVNVRKEANTHSKVIKKLDNNTLIFAFDYNKSEDGNWIYYDKEHDSYYIVATNSDAAGAYMVCWQIEKGIYKGRKIGIPF